MIDTAPVVDLQLRGGGAGGEWQGPGPAAGDRKKVQKKKPKSTVFV